VQAGAREGESQKKDQVISFTVQTSASEGGVHKYSSGSYYAPNTLTLLSDRENFRDFVSVTAFR
jgi:hypothetical protein